MNGVKILLFTDDIGYGDVIEQLFVENRAAVFKAKDAQSGLKMFFFHRPDIIVMNITTPQINGLSICSLIRMMSDVPIIYINSKQQDSQQATHYVQSIDCGAVDSIDKPFTPNALLSRVRSALDQALQTKIGEFKTAVYNDGYLQIDMDARRVTINGHPIHLTKTEYRLLTYLYKNANDLLTYRQIMNNVWGIHKERHVSSIHVYISRLRQKLEKDANRPQYFLLEYGMGYRFAGVA
ncbi:MAG: response regulator transcription factor [Chloroflexi bacterium]|nr:response regulator transcription factor [Chloroflexota bacterium]